MEQRFIPPFIFIFVFLGSFVILLGMMPTGLIYSGKQYTSPEDKENWVGLYLQASNATKSIILNNTLTMYYYDFDIGGRNLRLQVHNTNPPYTNLKVILSHRYGFLLMGNENMDWHNEKDENEGSEIYQDWFDEDYAEFQRLNYYIYCLGQGGFPLFGYSSAFHVQTSLSFNTTTYSKPSEAWIDDALYMFIGIDFDQTNTSINAWEIIGKLLTFQKVEVFGTDQQTQQMNQIMSLGILGTIIVMAVIVIIELIPF